MNISKLTILFLIIFSSSSCSVKIKNLHQYQKHFLNKSQFMPSKKDFARKSPKVVVFALEENDHKEATQAHLGVSIANHIENVLTKNRLAQLVNRNANKKLQKEIALAELNNSGSYKGPQVADYAVSGSIANAGFNSKYSSGKSYYNAKSGQFISVPPSYKYSSKVSGNIKIYELPSLRMVENIEFKGKESRSENVNRNGGVNLGILSFGGNNTPAKARDDSLVRQAGKDAISNIKAKLQNVFAKQGYILEKRIYDNNTIFKISLGSNDGIKKGDEFDIKGKFEITNPITDKSEIEKRLITSGKVSNIVNSKTAWVVINDKDQIDNIRLGDIVKIKYKDSILTKMLRFFKHLI